MLVGCATIGEIQTCSPLGTISSTADLRSLYMKYREPIVIIGGDNAYFCSCGGRGQGGDDEERKLGGDDEERKLGGDDEERKLGGDDEERKLGGDDEARKLGGDDEERKLGGGDEARKLGGGTQDVSCQVVPPCNPYKIMGIYSKIQLFDGDSVQPQSDGCLAY